jgi:hypothetical protein
MNSSTVVIVAFLCLSIGYIAGLLVSSLFGRHSKPENEADKPVIDKKSSILPVTTPTGEVPAPSKPISDPTRQVPPFDQALLWRERPGGPLQIDLDGKSYLKASNLTPSQRQRLAAWVPEIQAWLGIPLSRTSTEAGKRAIGTVNVLPETKVGEIRPEVNPKPTQPQAQKSIVAQIDEILQDQIGATALSGRGIRLSEAPGQGVTVWIGLEQFPGIEAVTDAEVLAAIRHAVKTWEAHAR